MNNFVRSIITKIKKEKVRAIGNIITSSKEKLVTIKVIILDGMIRHKDNNQAAKNDGRENFKGSPKIGRIESTKLKNHIEDGRLTNLKPI